LQTRAAATILVYQYSVEPKLFNEVGLFPSQALSCAGSEGIISGCFIQTTTPKDGAILGVF
jgi:hypothetical protein